MPQPIRSPELVLVNFRPGSILFEAHLAAHIGVVAAAWNDIESHLALLLATLIQGEPKTTVEMFLAITNDGAKRAAFDVVCRSTLNPTQQEQLQKTQESIGKHYVDRNKIVHGAWGISKNYPGKLLWTSIKDAISFHTDMMAIERSGSDEAKFERMMAYQKTIMLYDERDFVRVEDAFARTMVELDKFMSPFLDRAYGSSVLVLPKQRQLPRPGPRMKPDPSGN